MRTKDKIFKRGIIFIAAIFVTLALAGCGGDAGGGDDVASDELKGHSMDQEKVDAMLSELNDNLEFIGTVGPERTADLAQILTGSALEKMNQKITAELGQQKFRKRIYTDASSRFVDYTEPFAEVFVEFTDRSYFVDAGTGQPLDQPSNQKVSYAISLVEEEGKWKIEGIFEPAAASQNQAR